MINTSPDINVINECDDVLDDNKAKINLDNKEINFTEKCYIYGLPYNWSDEYTSINVEKNRKNKLTGIYNNVKKQLINKSVQIVDILKLKNITDSERIILIEKYAIMQSLDGQLNEYIKYRDMLRTEINYYKCRTTNLEELIIIEKQKDEFKQNKFSIDEIEQKILKLDIDKYSKNLIYQKYINNSINSSDFHKIKEWINTVVNIPFNISKPLEPGCKWIKDPLDLTNNINQKLSYIKKRLDEEIYGMKYVKEELLLIIFQRLANPNATNNSPLALVGPPGVGKTEIIKLLSSILCIPFEQLSMGGVNDPSFLDGHSYTYEGSKTGQIVKSLIKMKCDNGIIFIDEIDKVSKSDKGQEVSNQFLNMIDPVQNMMFYDKYISDIPINLSKIWFIFSMNDSSLLDPILKNRMNLINVPGYELKDKLEIINKHLVPKIIESLNFDINNIILTDTIKKYIIEKCSQEPGIRNLKTAINTLYTKLNLLCNSVLEDGTLGDLNLSFEIKNFKLPYELKISDITILLKDYMIKSNYNGIYV